MSFTFQNPFAYFNNPANSNPVGLGNLYVGLPDTDPEDMENPANQVPVFAVQPDGSELEIPQPVRMTAGGVLTYNGAPIQLKLNTEQVSVKITTGLGAQIYYAARWSASVTSYDLGNVNSTQLVNGFEAKYIARAVYASSYATPNVTLDQSLQLQTAWEYAASINSALIIDGTYWVGLNEYITPDIPGATQWVSLHAVNNTVVYFAPNASIKLLPNDKDLYYVINFFNRDNVFMHKPVIYGDRFDHTGATGESGNCYNITSCSNITLFEPKSYDAWGDGFYIGLEFFTNLTRQPSNIKIYNPESHNSSRNDYSICSGDGVHIVGSMKSSGTFRVAPGAALDIEPEFGDNAAITPILKNIKVDSIDSKNKVTSLNFAFFRPIGDWDVNIGSVVDDSSSTALQLLRSELAINSRGQLNIGSVVSKNSFGNPVVHGWFADKSCSVNIESIATIGANRSDDNAYRHTILFTREGSITGDISIGNIVDSASPNCLDGWSVDLNTVVRNAIISFIRDDRGNNGGFINAGGVIESSCVMSAKTAITASGLALDNADCSYAEFNTSSGNISFEVSSKSRRIFECLKTSSSNNLAITATPTFSIIKQDGTAVPSLTSSALYSYLELMDDGSGNKIVINQRGNWA